jgi:ADP-ribose pyrophosphatase YjhB (NUDIX family)
MTESPRHSVSVAAAIFDESGDNVLLIKRRDNGKWEPPGGVLELDETIEEGLRREVREETGAEIEVGPLTGVYKNMRLGILALVFRAAIESAPRESTQEAVAVGWLPLSALSGNLPPAYAQRIFDAATHSAYPAIVAHDGVNILPATKRPGGRQ